MGVVDDLDRKLLKLLQEDARHSYRTLARLADTTPPTAASRVRRMEELSIIRGYSVVLDPKAFGAGAQQEVDVDGVVRLRCAWCGAPSQHPRWAHVGGRRRPFCCTTCHSVYVDRHTQLAKGI